MACPTHPHLANDHVANDQLFCSAVLKWERLSYLRDEEATEKDYVWKLCCIQRQRVSLPKTGTGN
jgi:hypothetical protein